ncbi:MAG: hypothetical protein HC902_00710 [Calothrix sp. SM1_5_4]|nr:hypothetical protein [Calothrix sp. SM1_5_4]
MWRLDPFELERAYDQLASESRQEYDVSEHQIVRPLFGEVYSSLESLQYPSDTQTLTLTKVHLGEDRENGSPILPISTSDLKEIASTAKSLGSQASDLAEFLNKKLHEWKNLGYRVFVAVSTQAQAQRLKLLLEKSELQAELVEEGGYAWNEWLEKQSASPHLIHVVERPLGESLRYSDEHVIFLREEDLFGAKTAPRRLQILGHVGAANARLQLWRSQDRRLDRP